MSNNRRPQAPKTRNPVKKNMDKFQRPSTHRDRSKYDRIEDRWQDQLDDYLSDPSGTDDEEDDGRRQEFFAKLKGENHDPHMYEEYMRWMNGQMGFDREPIAGDVYLDTDEAQMYVHDGSKFHAMGPPNCSYSLPIPTLFAKSN